MTDIIREIDDELKAKHYKALAKKYGKYVIAIACIIILTFGGYAWIQSSNKKIHNKQASQFQRLISQENTQPEQWIEFAKKSTGGYSRMALRFAASQYIKQNDKEQAIKILHQLANDNNDDKAYRLFAGYMSTILAQEKGSEPIKNNKHFSAFAILVEAERLVANGNIKQAITILEQKINNTQNIISDNSAETALFSELANALKSYNKLK